MFLNKRNLAIVKLIGNPADPRDILNNLLIDIESGKTVVIDGKRLVTVTFPKNEKEKEKNIALFSIEARHITEDCLLEKSAVKKIFNAMPGGSQVAICNKKDTKEKEIYIAFSDNNFSEGLIAKKENRKFPDYKEVFPKGVPEVRICFTTEDFIEVLQLAKNYGDKIEIEIRKEYDPIVIRARDKKNNQIFEALILPRRRVE